ncbi:MAG: Ig-like domain-containing protein [Candidatus Eisenbacteria bacterium]|nr:Ig-like domain-containing protein [Candidatus Eisenbacteria bacterium]
MIRRGLTVLLALGLGLGLTRCTRDEVTGDGEGTIRLAYRASGATPADTLRVRVRSAAGAVVAGPIATGLGSGSGPIELEIPVPAGDGLAVEAETEGPGPGSGSVAARGMVARGATGGISIRAGRHTSAAVRLQPVVPRLEGVTANPGDLSYVVRWNRITGASGYHLWSRDGGVEAIRSVTDSFVVVTLTAQERQALLAGTFPERSYRVASRFGTAASIYGDSLRVEPDRFADLPRVLTVAPANGATAVPDTTAPRVIFDRAMDFEHALSTALRLRRQSDQILAPHALERVSPSEVVLRPSGVLDRGAAYRIEVGPGIADLEGRPLDQEPRVAGLQDFSSAFAVEVYDPLRVVSSDPLEGASDLGLRPVLRIRLNRAALPQSVGSGIATLTDSLGGLLPLGFELEDANLSLAIRPSQDLRFLWPYTLTVNGGLRDAQRGEPLDQDAATRASDPFVLHFRIESQPDGPSVIEVTPRDLAGAAPVFEAIRVLFSVPVDAATVNATSFNVRRLPLGANIPGTITASSDRREFTFTPNQLERDVRYQIVVATSVTDDEGDRLDQDRSATGFQEFSSSFRVERNPQVVSVDPPNNRIRVPIGSTVRVRFSLPIVPESVNDTTLVLSKAGIAIAATREVAPDSLSAVVTPIAPLDHLRTYDLRAATSIVSRRGSPLDSDLIEIGHQAFASRFTTEAESLPPRVLTALPADGDTLVGLRPEIEIHFTKPVRPVSINADFVLLRQLPSGSQVAATRVVSADSLMAFLTPTQDLEPRTRYELYVTNWVVDRFDVRLDQDPVAPGRQEFFSRWTTDQERTPPRVVAISPLDGEDEADRFAPIEVLFSEPMQIESLQGGAFRLLRGGVAVAGEASLLDEGRRLRFRQNLPLAADRTYSIEVDTTALDLSSNLLDQEPDSLGRQAFRSQFTTAPDREGPRVIASVPVADSSGVAVDTRPFLRFNEPLDPATVSTAAFALIDSLFNPVALSGLEFDGSSSITLTAAESLLFNAPYRLRALPALTDSLGNPLDQDSTLAGNQTFEIRFRTRQENIPPRVVRFATTEDPPRLDTEFSFRLSEPLLASSIVDSVVRVTAGDALVPLRLALVEPDSLVATPEDSLRFDTVYEVRLAGVRDRRGNVLDQDRATTDPDPFVTTVRTAPDTDPPAVRWVVPADSAGRVAPTVEVEVRFTEPLDTLTANASNLRLSRQPGDFLIEGAVRWSDDLRSLFHRPTAPLEEGASYEVRATSLITDLAGNGVDQDGGTPKNDEFASTFTVGYHPVVVLPAGLCDPPDSSRVTIDASGSSDPDPEGALTRVIWHWGDGESDTLSAPSGLIATHIYACLDRAADDGLDNDGDGDTDETGPDGCDESYHILLELEDVDGLRAIDSTGVAFRAWTPRSVFPPADSTGVDSSLAAIRVEFPEAIDLATAVDSTVTLSVEGGDPLSGTLSFEADDTILVWTPDLPLRAGTAYLLRIETLVAAVGGRRLDSDLCAPGRQPLLSRFQTAPPPSRPQDRGRAGR